MKRITLGKVIKFALTSLFVGILIGYAYHATQPFLAGPSLTLLTPENNADIKTPLIEVKGSVHNLSHLYLNGRSIAMTQDGTFTEELLLIPGYNTIELVGSDRFGREISLERQIVYTETEVHASATSTTPIARTISTTNHQ